MKDFTLIVPYYRNVRMLERQVEEWEKYPACVKVICVDDGSPEPARDVIDRSASPSLRSRLELYRVAVDIPWNRGGARNLGARHAPTDWLVHVDIDHILPVESCEKLLAFEPNEFNWYRFERWRVGKADATRKKDAIPDDCEFGRIHPHVDSYLMTKKMYWFIGGYDEDYSGVLGGGSAFLRQATARVPPRVLDIPLHVYTRSVIKDASDFSLSRDTSKGKIILRKKGGTRRPANPIRFEWAKVL